MNLSYNNLESYLTAGHDMDLAVFPDGAVQLIDHSRVWRDESEAPVSRVQCPGIANLDSTCFTEGFCDYNDEIGAYIETGTRRVIGDLADVISECCRDGDVEGYMDDLKAALARN